MQWNLILSLGEKIVSWFWNSREVKEFVIKLLERYSKSTDNDIDDSVVEIIKTALLK
jgi:hypothetical protein